MLASEKRLPVSGWLRSVMRSRGGETTGWWHNSFVIRKINKRICGREVDGRTQGIIEWLKHSYGHLFPLERGISVGCGDGSKEVLFIQAGIVASFELYELSEKAIEKGRVLSHRLGLANQMNFHLGIAAQEIKTPDSYDLVAWNDALHHMPDVSDALAWRRMILKPNGIFSMDDFVGATRFQWPDNQLALATAVRDAIPLKYRAIPGSPFRYPPSEVERPTIASMIASDPSEAADSERILPSLAKHFPEAVVHKNRWCCVLS
jgi:SAM-dependent methyltransferase